MRPRLPVTFSLQDVEKLLSNSLAYPFVHVCLHVCI